MFLQILCWAEIIEYLFSSVASEILSMIDPIANLKMENKFIDKTESRQGIPESPDEMMRKELLRRIMRKRRNPRQRRLRRQPGIGSCATLPSPSGPGSLMTLSRMSMTSSTNPSPRTRTAPWPSPTSSPRARSPSSLFSSSPTPRPPSFGRCGRVCERH